MIGIESRKRKSAANEEQSQSKKQKTEIDFQLEMKKKFEAVNNIYGKKVFDLDEDDRVVVCSSVQRASRCFLKEEPLCDNLKYDSTSQVVALRRYEPLFMFSWEL